jgi:hypothetical protein
MTTAGVAYLQGHRVMVQRDFRVLRGMFRTFGTFFQVPEADGIGQIGPFSVNRSTFPHLSVYTEK